MLFLACATLAADCTGRRKNSYRRRWPPDEPRFRPEAVPPESRIRGPKLSKVSRPRTERTFMPRKLTTRSESPDPSSVCRVIFAFDCRGRILRVFPRFIDANVPAQPGEVQIPLDFTTGERSIVTFRYVQATPGCECASMPREEVLYTRSSRSEFLRAWEFEVSVFAGNIYVQGLHPIECVWTFSIFSRIESCVAKRPVTPGSGKPA